MKYPPTFTKMGCSAVTEPWYVESERTAGKSVNSGWSAWALNIEKELANERERGATGASHICGISALDNMYLCCAFHLVYSLVTPCWARESHVGKWMKVTWEWLEGSSAQGEREGLDRQWVLGINALKAPSRECTSFFLFLLSHSSSAQHRGSKELWAVEKLRWFCSSCPCHLKVCHSHAY